MSEDIFARAGEMMTCENGHPIARVKADIARQSPARVADFDWFISAPDTGARMDETKCPECGAKYVGTRGLGRAAAHFEDGWRPGRPVDQ